jgi:pimeloyl-ACP methyl ester carboxylesterase
MWMTGQVQYVSVGSAKLGYRVHSDGTGKPDLVFVHGYAMNGTGPAYRDFLSALEKDFTVYSLDLRGHGASASETADWSLATLADDVVGFARELGLVGAVYVGHSIGGFTGMFAEIRHPGTFSALCLLATASASGGGHAPPETGALLTEKGRDPDAMHESFAPMYVRAGADEVKLAVESIGLMDSSVHKAFFADYPNRVLTGQIGDIDMPVLVLSGARDIVVPPAEQHLTALGLPRCKEVTFSGEGHMLPLEAAGLTAREIVAFCRYDIADTFSI